MNFSDKNLQQEIEQLIKIGINNGRLSRSTVVHLLSGNDQAIEDYASVISYMKSAGVFFVDEDIELDHEIDKEDSASFYQPFDSTKINIAQKPLSLEGILKRLKYKEIDMNTNFQRKSGLWDKVTKSQLIESMMLRIPLPVFYFDGTSDNKWLVIDGLQRLSTFKEFFLDKSLKLTGLEYFSDYNGCTCEDLPRTYIRRIEETQLSLYIIQPGTPENVKFNIFKRINTPGLKLENQEIRHALFQGEATDLLKRIAESETFEKVTNYSVSNERMLASEIVLRYLAFLILGLKKFEDLDGKQDEFLNETMKQINKMSKDQIRNIENKYYSSLNRSWEIFGIYAFRKMTALTNGRKNSFNVALYEAWMYNLGKLTNEEFEKIKARKDKLITSFIQLLLNDKTFGYDISSAKRIAVLRRIETIRNIIEETLHD
ncbi:MAG: DUF262 domain-containing protein [Eubacteriales bacterium]|nr:DUF262 domain-containing protein [Eubacteriales bacterium]